MSQPIVVRDKHSSLGVATRRNELLLGSYRLSLWAQRFFLLLISKVKDGDADDCVYQLSVAEIGKLIVHRRRHTSRSAPASSTPRRQPAPSPLSA